MLGIAIISYNRIEGVERTVRAIKANTKQRHQLVIADDGSPDGSTETLRAAGHTVISGKNMGVCWNKNRALFYLTSVRKCSTIILIEDDVWPTAPGWEADWVEATQYYGHVNLAGNWFAGGFVSGAGTPGDPFISNLVSGQCSSYSAEALSYVGYLDTRFQGYGVGHVEHSKRFMRAGFGGLHYRDNGRLLPGFVLIKSPLNVTSEQSYKDEAQIASNERLFTEIKDETVCRSPWRTDREMTQFRDEIRQAQSPSQRGVFDEAFYLGHYPDVARGVRGGAHPNGEDHYLSHGQHEQRLARYIRDRLSGDPGGPVAEYGGNDSTAPRQSA